MNCCLLCLWFNALQSRDASDQRHCLHPADLLESRYFQQEVSLTLRFFLLWLVGMVARCKY
jgi:hypothetical protein